MTATEHALPLLHERFPQLRETLPHIPVCTRPTPVRELSAVAGAAESRVPLWLKDDGRSAPRWGGNKPRKLEWLLADVKRRGYRTILTFGGLGTHHGLATALHGAEHGIGCALALVDQPRDEHVEEQLRRLRASGAHLHFTRTSLRTALASPYLIARHAQLRPPRPPYVLAPGGSSPLGSIGFVEAALELGAQVQAGELPEPEAVVIALGSGGSAAGLAAGLPLAGLRTRVVAVLVSDVVRLSERTVRRLARRSLRLLERRGAPAGSALADVEVVDAFLGGGYGHHTPEARRASELAAETEGLELEPVYTAKAMAALLDGRLSRGRGPVLYWHTHSAA